MRTALSLAGRNARFGGDGCDERLPCRGEDDCERRPRAGLRLHFDHATRVSDDTLAYRKSEPRPLRFGGEKGDKEVSQNLRRNTWTGIADGDFDEIRLLDQR